ncbi:MULTISPECIES: anti-sigma factor [unclassified Leptolyngbya]|uniref:anti-sigma factor n=1 Tax=unclassified Leptolyngbya TaxID=2650499 RepID=UPI0016823A45|nr:MULTISPECIES: anti-sigma factor [unclassified Leptolyngbya]MBD1911380.1 anti-sigma factor [Leptolyngbya sp. FACHB-8]MBD2156602.1 anti-sigma factor [Leptolyngbya sp. FACHB-16]
MIQPAFDPTDELLAGYVLGDLTPDEQATVEQYLAQDSQAIAQVEQLRSTLALLSMAASAASLPTAEADSAPIAPDDRMFQDAQPGSLPHLPLESAASLSTPEADRPPAALRDRILQAATPEPQRARPRRLGDRQLWSIGGIAAFVLLGLGLGNYRLQQELMASRQKVQEYEGAIAILQQPQNRLLNLQPVSQTQSPTGSLVLAPHGNVAMLTLQNLKPLPSGMVYRMWAFATTGEKFDCATFTPDASGQVLLKLTMNPYWAEATTVVINIEPLQSTATMKPERVLTSEL